MRPVNNFDVLQFEHLEFNTRPYGIGKQAVVQFKNGYGASVIQGEMSYGGREGLFELAVYGKDGNISYSTPITGDVLGYLTEDDVTETLVKISKLE